MSAKVIQLRREEPAETSEPEGMTNLEKLLSEIKIPPGAKPVDGVAFGQMDRDIQRLKERVAVLEQRLSVLAERLASKEDQ